VFPFLLKTNKRKVCSLLVVAVMVDVVLISVLLLKGKSHFVSGH
jgi:hypothetical protein